MSDEYKRKNFAPATRNIKIYRMNSSLPRPILNAIEALSDLPGIGSRSAERLVFNLLKNETGLDKRIAEALGNLKDHITRCPQCFHFCEKIPDDSPEALKADERCQICKNNNRQQKTLCVVETSLDLIALERTHEYRGEYHVLGGVISPLNKIRPEDIFIPQLLQRVTTNSEIEEIILALSGSVESEATALYLQERLQNIFSGKISRIARGIPSGGDLDYLDVGTLSRAILDRREV